MDWSVVIAEAGDSLHGWEYPPDVLKAAVPLFDKRPVRAHPYLLKGRPQVKDGLPVFRHLPESEAHMAPFLVKECIGTLADPWMHDGAVLARLRMLPSCELSDDVLHTYGLSMQVGATVNRDAQKNPVSVHKIGFVESVDLVDTPALSGRILGPWLSRQDAEKWHRAERNMVRFEEATQRYEEVERRQKIISNYEARLDAVVSRFERRMSALAARI